MFTVRCVGILVLSSALVGCLGDFPSRQAPLAGDDVVDTASSDQNDDDGWSSRDDGRVTDGIQDSLGDAADIDSAADTTVSADVAADTDTAVPPDDGDAIPDADEEQDASPDPDTVAELDAVADPETADLEDVVDPDTVTEPETAEPPDTVTAPDVDDDVADPDVLSDVTVDSDVSNPLSCASPGSDGTPCDDGDTCTVDDACAGGLCVGSALECAPADACHVPGSCDPSTGLCKPKLASSGTPCDDGNACTTDDACLAGLCRGNTAVECPEAALVCDVVVACDPVVGCVNVDAPNGNACDDGVGATPTSTCQAGVCTGACASGFSDCGGKCVYRGDACGLCPTPDGGLPIDVSAGGLTQCVVMDDGTVRCWGDNTYGQLGLGCSSPSWNTPITVPGISGATRVFVGPSMTCALLAGGRVKCWGRDHVAQLGAGYLAASVPWPIEIPGLADVVEVSMEDGTSCARLEDGRVMCWGNNDIGMAGIGNYDTPVFVPRPVVGITTATRVAVGHRSACASLADGTGRCWGSTFGNGLGNTLGSTTTPNPVFGLDTILEIASTGFSRCARLEGGTVRCWGTNYGGVLGIDEKMAENSATPASPIQGITGAKAIAGSEHHMCAIMSDDTVKCWGQNSSGQLGDGSVESSAIAVDALGLDDVTLITAGAQTTCALRGDHSVWCWGYNAGGSLGVGPTAGSVSVPMRVLGL
jgi:alpha-tubulin suppressor-like RCC1 family protein